MAERIDQGDLERAPRPDVRADVGIGEAPAVTPVDVPRELGAIAVVTLLDQRPIQEPPRLSLSQRLTLAVASRIATNSHLAHMPPERIG